MSIIVHVQIRITILPVTIVRNSVREHTFFVRFVLKFFNFEIHYFFFVYRNVSTHTYILYLVFHVLEIILSFTFFYYILIYTFENASICIVLYKNVNLIKIVD